MELDEQDFDYDLDPSAFDPSGNSNFSCFENGTLEVPFEVPGANHTIENGTEVRAFFKNLGKLFKLSMYYIRISNNNFCEKS